MRTHRLLVGLAAVALISAAACMGSDTTSVAPTDWSKVTFDSSLHVNLDSMTKTGNMYYRDSTVGTGQSVGAGSMVSVRYTGWLASNGLKFDTNDTTAAPFQFTLGIGYVIPGWDQGLIGMKVGGTRKLVIPPEMAYGPGGAGNGLIPPNAVLVFSVRLVSSP